MDGEPSVQTVLGAIEGTEMGITLPHEHLLVVNPNFVEPVEASTRALAYEPLSIEILGWVRQHWTQSQDNLRLLDEDTAIAEASQFKRWGGETIVDATVEGIGRDPLALKRISRATGLHIVMGTGYYVAETHPEGVKTQSVDLLANHFVSELTTGVHDTGVVAGFIGEVGCHWPLRPDEKKVLEAAGAAATQTGVAVMVHPGRDPKAPAQILEILHSTGLAYDRIVIAHIERTVQDPAQLVELAQTGCHLEFDVFGLETSMFPPVAVRAEDGSTIAHLPPNLDMPSDAQRLSWMEHLVENGYANQVLISQDISTKHRLTKYGGHGYGHILATIVPWMRRRGADESIVETLLVHNPRQVFCS